MSHVDFKDESDLFISGGYRILKYVKRPNYSSADLLPDEILTTSTCMVNTIPGSWATPWSSDEKIERDKIATEFGLNAEDQKAITDWTTLQMNIKAMEFPDIFYSTQAARDFLSLFNIATEKLVIVGIGIRKNIAKDFVDTCKVDRLQDGLISTVELGQKLENRGLFLGYEIYGHEGGWYHSWLCNGLEKVALKKFSIAPNKHGFINDYEDAKKCAEYFEDPDLGAETVPWYPWGIFKYHI